MPTPDDQLPTGDMPASDGTTERYRDAISPGLAGERVGERVGDEIGPYRLLAFLGEGGFGTVWKAERRHPFRQTVAIKFLHSTQRDFIARFEQERQMLASLNHPGIARILEGGVTASGRPYFAMEFVEGLPITRWCDEQKLPVPDRLRLFVQLCEAVQHAHMSGIIHRDLKPGNVLVSRGEGDVLHVKLIDFGIAKSLSGGMTDKTLLTILERPIGTAVYMSPEQASPDGTRIDIRTDVYSLGVMLYELLVGATPFDPAMLRARGMDEIKRIIREEDPPTPSARLSTVCGHDSARRDEFERARGVRMPELVKELRSELEWIPLMAMRKERERRYERPLDLARDIESYLAGRPIVAAPDSRVYRARKWFRRNRTAVGGVALVAVALAVGLGYRPATDAYREWSETRRMNAYEVLAQDPDPAVVTDADARERIKATGKPWKIRHTASGIVMLLCPPGEFLMGSPKTEEDRDDDETQHKRVIRSAFYLSQFEVSKAQWRAMTGKDSGYFKGDDLPVESVSWDKIHDDFLAASRGFFRLPSEAEWEYACRAGTTTAYSFGDTITKEQVRFAARDGPASCGKFPANPWGFHDMHGNVWEWVEDEYAEYPKDGGTEEAVVTGERTDRVLRGGSWDGNANDVRSSGRSDVTPDNTDDDIGFRVARAPL